MNSKEKLIEKIHNYEAWDDQLKSSLMGFGFQDPSKCWNDLISIAKAINFKKFGSARKLYNFNIDNASDY